MNGIAEIVPKKEEEEEEEKRYLSARARRFLALRTTTLVWGFAVSYFFTGSLLTSIAMWTVVVIGNTFLMWRFR